MNIPVQLRSTVKVRVKFGEQSGREKRRHHGLDELVERKKKDDLMDVKRHGMETQLLCNGEDGILQPFGR